MSGQQMRLAKKSSTRFSQKYLSPQILWFQFDFLCHSEATLWKVNARFPFLGSTEENYARVGALEVWGRTGRVVDLVVFSHTVSYYTILYHTMPYHITHMTILCTYGHTMKGGSCGFCPAHWVMAAQPFWFCFLAVDHRLIVSSAYWGDRHFHFYVCFNIQNI